MTSVTASKFDTRGNTEADEYKGCYEDGCGPALLLVSDARRALQQQQQQQQQQRVFDHWHRRRQRLPPPQYRSTVVLLYCTHARARSEEQALSSRVELEEVAVCGVGRWSSSCESFNTGRWKFDDGLMFCLVWKMLLARSVLPWSLGPSPLDEHLVRVSGDGFCPPTTRIITITIPDLPCVDLSLSLSIYLSLSLSLVG